MVLFSRCVGSTSFPGLLMPLKPSRENMASWSLRSSRKDAELLGWSTTDHVFKRDVLAKPSVYIDGHHWIMAEKIIGIACHGDLALLWSMDFPYSQDQIGKDTRSHIPRKPSNQFREIYHL